MTPAEQEAWGWRLARTCGGCGLKRVGPDGRCAVCEALKFNVRATTSGAPEDQSDERPHAVRGGTGP
jgi:hypothetical protein